MGVSCHFSTLEAFHQHGDYTTQSQPLPVAVMVEVYVLPDQPQLLLLQASRSVTNQLFWMIPNLFPIQCLQVCT